MSCQQHCPISKANRQPQHRLDQVRRRLEFSESSPESHGVQGPPADKYGNFKRVSDAHSSHEIESPMYTSAQLASVPDSFLEYFARAPPRPPSPRKATPPHYHATEADELPESFLQYCEEKIAARGPCAPQPPTPPRPPQRSPRSMSACSPYCMQDVTPGPPYNTSYYGYDMYPGDPHRMLFEPTASSTPRPPTPPPQAPQGYYPTGRMPYHVNKAPSYEESHGAVRFPSPLATSTPIGSGKYGQPTPPPRSSGCTSPCAATPESSVSTGDFSCSPSRRSPASPARSRSLGASQASPARNLVSSYESKSYSYEETQGAGNLPAPIATSTPKVIGRCGQPAISTPPCATLESTVSSGDLLSSSPRGCGTPPSRSKSLGANQPSPARYTMHRKETSTSSLGRDRSHTTDGAYSETSNPCHRCPTLGVTPVHSGVSFSSSVGNIDDSRQSIRKGIENELIVREQQERSQLEADLSRWQQARRKLVINTASMGS